MSRIGTLVCSGALAFVVACTSGGSVRGSLDAASTPEGSTPEGSTPVGAAATPLEGEWSAVITVSGMRRTGFTPAQIQADQKHEGWSSRYELGLSVTGESWVLTEAPDDQPTVVGAHGPLSVSEDHVLLTDDTPPQPSCTVTLRYRVRGDDLTMSFIRSDCDENPLEPIPDFMYAAVLVQPFHRVV